MAEDKPKQSVKPSKLCRIFTHNGKPILLAPDGYFDVFEIFDEELPILDTSIVLHSIKCEHSFIVKTTVQISKGDEVESVLLQCTKCDMIRKR